MADLKDKSVMLTDEEHTVWHQGGVCVCVFLVGLFPLVCPTSVSVSVVGHCLHLSVRLYLGIYGQTDLDSSRMDGFECSNWSSKIINSYKVPHTSIYAPNTKYLNHMLVFYNMPIHNCNWKCHIAQSLCVLTPLNLIKCQIIHLTFKFNQMAFLQVWKYREIKQIKGLVM